VNAEMISGSTEAKFNKLKEILRSMERVLVAFSGGVDSTFLLRVAQDVLKDDVLAVIASSETYPEKQEEEAIQIADNLNVQYRIIHTDELQNPEFVKNPPQRCYHCKKELFLELKKIASQEDIPYVIDGENHEDKEDFRPGSKAAEELGVRSPLKEAALRKSEIRLLSKRLALPTWDKPSMACLASRFPYFKEIDRESLRQVAQAEEFLQAQGFSQVRVRHHDQIARIEVRPDDFSRMIDEDMRNRVVENLKKMGYLYVSLDLAGYRTGSMNEPLSNEE
jgi:uncharacterized protein